MTAPVPGTQPHGVRDEREASAFVRRMFSQIAPRYDTLNHLLSWQLDRPWRTRTASRFAHILNRADAHVLDLCCGTGDLTLALWSGHKKGSVGARVWGADFAHPMLVRAHEKAAKHATGAASRAQLTPQFAEADALQMPFAAGSFDLVTTGFGFRNLANYTSGLREIHRVLKPGGEVGILEFTAPRNPIFAAVYNLYMMQIVPRLGGAISGNKEAYAYLPVSVSKFPTADGLASLMSANGFVDARYELWMFGTVALHIARKP